MFGDQTKKLPWIRPIDGSFTNYKYLKSMKSTNTPKPITGS